MTIANVAALDTQSCKKKKRQRLVESESRDLIAASPGYRLRAISCSCIEQNHKVLKYRSI